MHDEPVPHGGKRVRKLFMEPFALVPVASSLLAASEWVGWPRNSGLPSDTKGKNVCAEAGAGVFFWSGHCTDVSTKATTTGTD